MNKSDLTKPTRVARAKDRLEAAVRRLESALESRAGAGSGETDEIVRQLEDAFRDRDALKAANSELGTRLDGAIRRIRRVLEA